MVFFKEVVLVLLLKNFDIQYQKRVSNVENIVF